MLHDRRRHVLRLRLSLGTADCHYPELLSHNAHFTWRAFGNPSNGGCWRMINAKFSVVMFDFSAVWIKKNSLTATDHIGFKVQNSPKSILIFLYGESLDNESSGVKSPLKVAGLPRSVCWTWATPQTTAIWGLPKFLTKIELRCFSRFDVSGKTGCFSKNIAISVFPCFPHRNHRNLGQFCLWFMT